MGIPAAGRSIARAGSRKGTQTQHAGASRPARPARPAHRRYRSGPSRPPPQLNDWFLRSRDPESGAFPDLPDAAKGGSRRILRPPPPESTPEEAAALAAAREKEAKGKGAKGEQGILIVTCNVACSEGWGVSVGCKWWYAEWLAWVVG